MSLMELRKELESLCRNAVLKPCQQDKQFAQEVKSLREQIKELENETTTD